MRQVKEESEDKLIGNYVLKNFYEFWLTCVLQICFLYRFDIMVVFCVEHMPLHVLHIRWW